MPTGRRHDWHAMRALYVHGVLTDGGQLRYPTLLEVADQYDVSPSLVRVHAGKEHWSDARAEAQAELDRARVAKRAAEFLEVSSRIDQRSVAMAEQGIQLVHARVQELVALQGQRLQQLSANPNAALADTDMSMELTRLGLAGVRFHQLAMRATGQEAERAGALPAGGGDPTDLAVSAAERRLAEQVASRVNEAITVGSTELARASETPG